MPLEDEDAQREFELLQKQFALITDTLASQGETGLDRPEENPDIDDAGRNHLTGEINGPRGREPTRFGDWERKGRVSDF